MIRSSIKTPQELKNKKIGGDRYGSLSDLILRELRNYNVVPDRVHKRTNSKSKTSRTEA
jgi:ABC-type nitrate/sulfonate/bicarbonate transport system substrate-binding protein